MVSDQQVKQVGRQATRKWPLEIVAAFGNPCSGKTHLLCAIGRRIYFITSVLVVQDLLVAKRDLKISRFIKKLAHFEGLIVDDLGYVQQVKKRWKFCSRS